ncbi:ThuA domain-containing protein [Pedobacter nutrimenti]|uniref:ThuA domain-containing protein n=1 Tax=Pedobacter nutrimenti TaxID=1241337 RepID=UPI002931221A|nr:ThuA domain-containing protein [Pedobacter nutrimenti]
MAAIAFGSTKKNNDRLQLLILTGSSNHDWEATTLQLKKNYTENNRFEVFVTKSPDTLNFQDFKKFDVVVSNWNAWPENHDKWTMSAKAGLMRYIEQGGGFVLIHSANAVFYDWDEFHELIGATWGDQTTHGKITKHKIIIKDKHHPITKGMHDFWITDELWVNAKVQPKLNVLAEAYSDPKNKGRGLMEPVFLWNEKGKGRCFSSILGHDVTAMENKEWKRLVLRGTEWAATGKVTIC